MSPAVLPVDEATFDQEVLRSDRPVIVDFWAPWCGPCRVMHPVIHELATQHPAAKFVQLDVDPNPAIQARFQVLSIPTLLVFEGGRERKRLTGAMSRNRLVRELEPWLRAVAA